MKLRLCTIIACVAVSGVMFAGCRSSTVATGEPLNFSATTIDGQSFSTADHRGRVLLVNFFATWCPPCIEEMPALAEMYQRYNPQGLDIDRKSVV